jgi:hypothetical protein
MLFDWSAGKGTRGGTAGWHARLSCYISCVPGRKPRVKNVGFALLAVITLGCQPAATAKAPDTRTERQKDSALAASKIPGAGGVGAALRAADTTSAQARALDTVAQ